MANTKYAALSHCWGTKSHLKTISENLDAMLSGISLQAVSKTCQDAVHLCRDLRIRYLWIDTLCAIQDHASECRREAGRMSTVYGNAFLVLVASASRGDEDGMFPKRLDYYLHTVSFEWNGRNIELKLQPWREHQESLLGGEGPLSERNWAYQERLLGRRVLLYHANEIAWECNEMRRCECGLGDRVGDSKHPYNLHEIIGSNQQSAQRLYENWRMEIAGGYAPRILSKQTDKLPAISGVAEVFRFLLKDDYLAGLWRHDLIRGLLWRNSRLLYAFSLPSEYCAPSWSWASLAGGSAHYSNMEDEEFCAEILDVHCETVGKEPTDEVTYGWIMIFGPLADGWFMMLLEIIEKLRYPTIMFRCNTSLEQDRKFFCSLVILLI
ncbi:het domain-containing protein [Rutstroemia sp. NJR-2017a BVV2]|nr:het domain-containing protein [Rutstroemia sp. NJR-2017a BVV2]